MAILHDTAVRSSIETRIRALGPDITPRWGKMSADQMLWHVNRVLGQAMGEVQPTPVKLPMPRPMLKFVVLRMPWMKGAPTNPAFLPKERYNFEAERARCLQLIDRFTRRSLDEAGQPNHPFFGRVSGADMSHLQAKHLNHHLTQFGV